MSGKIVYLHPGHGWTLGSGGWNTQRPETFEVVEDLLNQDFINFQAQALWNAGATIVPLRPIGFQVREVVLDNDDPGVSFAGSWFESGSPLFFGDAGDVPYLFASASAVETATATYRPEIPESGIYPVYAWTLGAGNRVDQLYRVNHSGGSTEVRIDHREVGGGLVYLGSYHFDEGSGGSVVISNQSNQSGVVIADMIRFGNGVGPSGFPRHDEAGLYWIQAHAGRGISSSEYGTSTVTAPPRWAEYMNLGSAADLPGRVFLSHHSNAAGGTARGAVTLLNGNNDPGSRTPNQLLYAELLVAEIDADMTAQDGLFEHNWFDRGRQVLDRTDFEFGEMNNRWINGEFDATLVERAFHDNQLDAELLRDPRFNVAIARATYQGLVRYFNAVDGGVTPIAFAPERVADVRATPEAGGRVTIEWSPPPSSGVLGGAAAGYRVQRSRNGRGFDDGVVIAGGLSTGAVLTGLEPGLHFFRVVATNPGGWSLPSPVVAATVVEPGADPGPEVLVVDGFDRLDRFMNVREPYRGGTIDRVRPRWSNSYDYVIQHASSVHAAGATLATTTNDGVVRGLVDLGAYEAVVWFLGEESSRDITLDDVERAAIGLYLDRGGSLLLSGTEIAWDLGLLNRDPDFLLSVLGASYAGDDAGTYTAVGLPGTLFGGLDLSFDDGRSVYDANFPDVLLPAPGVQSVAAYSPASFGAAAVRRDTPAGGHAITLGFPFETILNPVDRDGLMLAALDLFGVIFDCVADINGDNAADVFDLVDYLVLFSALDPAADLDQDGTVGVFDLIEFLVTFAEGC